MADSRQLLDQEYGLRKLLKKKLLGLCSLDRSIARQRLRLLQLREGDANTTFFQTHARHGQQKNVIASLQHDVAVHTGQQNIAEVVDDYYADLFGSVAPRVASVNLDMLDLLFEDLMHLEEPFTAEEVGKAIKSLSFDKAPGPDGFTGRFYVTCWQIIRVDFMRTLEQFHRGDVRGLPAINKALVSLLPKMVVAVDIKCYRPVSLISGSIIVLTRSWTQDL